MKLFTVSLVLASLLSFPRPGFADAADEPFRASTTPGIGDIFRNLFGNRAKDENNQGNDARNAGRYDEARAHYKKATEIDPSYARAHYNLGHMLFILHQEKEALESLNRAVALNQNGAGFTTRGVVRLALGDIRGAFQDQEQALRLAPADWTVVPYNYGCAKMFAGDAAGAAEEFARAKLIPSPNLDKNQVSAEMKQKVAAAIRKHGGKFSGADLTDRHQQAAACGVSLN